MKAKLTKSEVLTILAVPGKKRTWKYALAVASNFKVTRATVRRIWLGKTWKMFATNLEKQLDEVMKND